MMKRERGVKRGKRKETEREKKRKRGHKLAQRGEVKSDGFTYQKCKLSDLKQKMD